MLETPAKIRHGIDDILDDMDWKRIFTFRFVFGKLVLLMVAVVVMSVFYFGGSLASGAIDSRFRRSTRKRIQDIREARSNGGGGVGKKERDEQNREEDDIASRFASQRTIASYTGRFVHWIIVLSGFLVVLNVLGIDIATIITLVVIVAIVVGLIVQGTLKDISSGAILALFQTYEVGDVIRIGDRDGTVIDFRFINTLIQDLQSTTLVTVPNNIIQKSIVINFSRSIYHVFSFTARLSNIKNASFSDIVEMVARDLQDNDKYPEIYRTSNASPRVGVDDISQPATILVVDVPMTPTTDLYLKRLSVRTKVRELLAENDVKLWPTR